MFPAVFAIFIHFSGDLPCIKDYVFIDPPYNTGNDFVYEGTVKHIFFIAETKGTMESLELRPIEQAKISCVKKLFNEMSTSNVVHHDVDSYQSLLNIMNSL